LAGDLLLPEPFNDFLGFCFREALLLRKSLCSSSFFATFLSHKALMPFTKRIAEELAKFSIAGAAS